jgi:RNA polymerase sigma factor (TIGR02999 family)
LVTLVYGELRQMAYRQMAQETPGQTLQPTALVHEAYARLVGADIQWQNRGHFFAAAARAMRQILVNRAHRRQAIKHGGGRRRVDLADIELVPDESRPEMLIALDRAIERLDAMDHRKAQIVMLRFFSGLTIKETAQALAISPTTVKDDWVFARTWLYREMTRDE